MMVLTGGRERMPDEFARLFTESGFQLTRAIPTPGVYAIIEAATA